MSKKWDQAHMAQAVDDLPRLEIIPRSLSVSTNIGVWCLSSDYSQWKSRMQLSNPHISI